jgi:hypothetical protein
MKPYSLPQVHVLGQDLVPKENPYSIVAKNL